MTLTKGLQYYGLLGSGSLEVRMPRRWPQTRRGCYYQLCMALLDFMLSSPFSSSPVAKPSTPSININVEYNLSMCVVIFHKREEQLQKVLYPRPREPQTGLRTCPELASRSKTSREPKPTPPPSTPIMTIVRSTMVMAVFCVGSNPTFMPSRDTLNTDFSLPYRALPIPSKTL